MSPEHEYSRLATQDSQLIFGNVADKVTHRTLNPSDVRSDSHRSHLRHFETSTDGLTARLLRRNEVMRVRFRLGALDFDL